MGRFGSEPMVGAIGRCAQCGNNSEIRVYPNDNPQPICESCYLGNQQLEQKITEKKESASIQTALENSRTGLLQSSIGSDERELYIRTISNKASDEWLKHFINEVVTKQVLIYDWKTIIRNERWFSLLDLRRFALEVDPNLDKPEPPKSVRMFEPEPKVKRGRPKKTQRKEEIHLDA
jgi:hypothetical protein